MNLQHRLHCSVYEPTSQRTAGVATRNSTFNQTNSNTCVQGDESPERRGSLNEQNSEPAVLIDIHTSMPDSPQLDSYLRATVLEIVSFQEVFRV